MYISIILTVILIMLVLILSELIKARKLLGLNIKSGDFAHIDTMDDDELYGEAKELVINSGKASASYLQRRLSIGYARAAKFLDMLEEEGVVGRYKGSEPRDVLVKK
jgi:S-DNA-T family DNA segregation ATPase FtsK/SpoIIIE